MDLRYYNRYLKFISIIKNLGDRNLKGYVELHHIHPRCLNGTDDPSNLIVLSLREHFLAHWLLWKAYPNFLPLASAFLQMNNKNPKAHFKGNQGRITSRTYQQLKTSVYDKLKEYTTNKVRVRDADGNILTFTKEEYANQSTYKFHTSGKVYVFDLNTDSWVYITSDEYQQNKDRYKPRTSLENFPHGNRNANPNPDTKLFKFRFLDTKTNEILKITKTEARKQNAEYGYKRLIHIQRSRVTCVDQNGDTYNVSLDEYRTNTSSHSHLFKDKVTVFDTQLGKVASLSKEEYYQNPNRYKTSTKGKVLAKDKSGNSVLITKEDFDAGNYVGQTKGLRTVLDKRTNQHVQITKEEYNQNKDHYVGPNQGKVNVIDKITGERKQISKEDFDKTLYVGLGNKKFLFLCQNKLTGKEKYINIYEWDIVKEHYIVLDQAKFNKASQSK
jgi:hypothetical protein